ncbi:hypothetical protein GJ496_008424 [Pomphorhynchus laevis]|nr:hypothetical protein GJ496_008424 [Pomphorhynchus laevis]
MEIVSSVRRHSNDEKYLQTRAIKMISTLFAVIITIIGCYLKIPHKPTAMIEMQRLRYSDDTILENFPRSLKLVGDELEDFFLSCH